MMDIRTLKKQQLIEKLEQLLAQSDDLRISKSGTQVKASEDPEGIRKQFNDLFESSPDMLFILHPDGKVIWVNKTGAATLGYTTDELLGQPVWKVVDKSNLTEVKNKIARILKERRAHSDLYFYKVKKDGTRLFVHEKTQLIFDQVGHTKEIRIICRDISKRKLAEEALKVEEEKFKSITHNLNVGIYRSASDENGKFIDFNPAFMKMFGYKSKKELYSKTVSSLYFNPNDRKKLTKIIQKKGSVKNKELSLVKKDGTIFTGSISTVVTKDKSGEIKYYDGIIEDITEQKEALDQLFKREEQYRTLFNFSPDGILLEKTDGTIIDANPAYCKITGYKREELLGKKVHILAEPDSHERVDENIIKLKQGKHLKHIEKSIKKDGTKVLVELNERKFVLPDGGTGIICIAEDITKRVIAEENLKNSEESYRGLFNSTTDAIYIQDKDGRFVDVNKGAVKMYGYPRKYFIGKTPEFLSAPGMNDKGTTEEMFRNALQGNHVSFEFWGIDRKGRIFPKEVRLNKGKYFGQDVIIAFAQDITERKAAQKTLQESEKKYRKIFHAFPDIYFRSDLNGIVEEISPSVKRIIGFRPDEIIGKDSRRFYLDSHDWQKIGDLLNATGKVEDFDTCIRLKRNKYIHCSLTALLIHNENEQPIGVEGVLRDITDRKIAEEKLIENQRRLATLMGNLPGMAYRCLNDKNWTMEFVSDGCLTLTEYQASELLGNRKASFSELIHPEDQSMVWNTVQEALLKNEPFRMIYRIQTKSGKLKWVWEQGIGIYGDDGALISLEGFIANITEQKLVEEELRKFSRSVEQTPTIVVITKLNGNIEYVNPKFTKVTGYSPDEVINKNPRILKSGKTPAETYTALWQTITSGKEWSGEFINKKKNGDLYWESANISPLKDEKGRITHFIAMKEDITDRKAMEEDLIRAKDKAEESDKLKSAFLANMSHEIRTPMNAIIGFSQLLSEPDTTSEEQNHYISLIQKSGGDLLSLIDDIIDISKIEAGQLKIFKSDYFADAILTEIYESYVEYLKTTADKKDIKLKYNRTEKLKSVVIHTDIDKLKQVIRNLINNALKFTDFGLIEFGAEITNEGRDKTIQFYVRDTGIGIPNDKFDVIFESFRQLDGTNKRLYGGTGLGLAITKKIVELLGGEIWVKSAQGQGSTFYFNLPYNPLLVKEDSFMVKPETNIFKKYRWDNKHILIVEDDEQSFLFYQSVLKKTHVTITRASDGPEAIEHCKKHKFDLILMDIRMPKMDGYATSKKILTIDPKVKIIAQTAYAMAGEKQRSLDTGCVDYISKPISIGGFLKVIEKYI